jgi:hypothetical protein
VVARVGAGGKSLMAKLTMGLELENVRRRRRGLYRSPRQGDIISDSSSTLRSSRSSTNSTVKKMIFSLKKRATGMQRKRTWRMRTTRTTISIVSTRKMVKRIRAKKKKKKLMPRTKSKWSIT